MTPRTRTPLRSRTSAWLLVALLPALVGCGEGVELLPPKKHPAPKGAPKRGGQDTPKEAPKPPEPVTKSFQESSLWYEAASEGTFKDIPPARLDSLADLLATFVGVQQDVEKSTGETQETAAGPSYVPTDAELRLAEVGARLLHLVRGVDPDTVRAHWARSGIEVETLRWKTFSSVTSKEPDAGWVTVVEVQEQELARPNRS